jgi:L-malate glycosyltransferase
VSQAPYRAREITLNVVFIAGWYPSADQPMDGVFVRDHARAAAIHHRVAVVAPRQASDIARPFVVSWSNDRLPTIRVGYRHVRIPLGTGVAHTSGVLAALGRLKRSGFRPDLIHAHVHEVGLAALIVARRYRVPLIISEHSSHFSLGTLPADSMLRAQKVFRAADLICPVSEDLRRHMERQGVHGKFHVVPNPVDTEVFTPSPAVSDGPTRALFVGGLDPIKRVDRLLSALAKLGRRDIYLDVVGDGPIRGHLEEQARRLGLVDVVRFHGYLPRSAVAERLRAAHFLVLTSAVETFGIVLAESLVAGRPVVAVRVGAIPEIVDGRSGMLVPPGDEGALASAIGEMAARRGDFDWRALSNSAVARFGLAAVGAEWDATYRSLTR